MKLSDILLLTLFFVMGSMIFAIKQMQADRTDMTPNVPAPTLKPAPLVEADLPKLRLDFSRPEAAGSHGRLSLDEFLAKGTTQVITRDPAPKASAEKTLEDTIDQDVQPKPVPTGRYITKTGAIELDPAPLNAAPIQPEITSTVRAVEPINLVYLPDISEDLFIDRVTEFAEASPVKPGARGCGSINENSYSNPKRAKVRSVGMARQLTDRASVGVEYVYKDGCYKNAIAPLQSLDMPGDDGVNLRVNMRF